MVRGRVNQVLWAEQFWNGHPQKLDREIFEDCPSMKIGPLENFPLYGITLVWSLTNNTFDYNSGVQWFQKITYAQVLQIQVPLC